ncbi:hypothetical protein AAHC03_016696 [Spirometra sp. Aus1]
MVDAVLAAASGLGFVLTRPDDPSYWTSDSVHKSNELGVPVVISESGNMGIGLNLTLEFRGVREKLAFVYHRARDLCRTASFLPVELDSQGDVIKALKGLDQLLTKSYFWEKMELDRGKLRERTITTIDRLSHARSFQRDLRRRVNQMDSICHDMSNRSN